MSTLESWVRWRYRSFGGPRAIYKPELSAWLSSHQGTETYDISRLPTIPYYVRKLKATPYYIGAISIAPHRSKLDNLREVTDCAGVLGYIALAACIYNEDLSADDALRRLGGHHHGRKAVT